MTLAVGERLGPYEIVGVLGAGGMGEVYRARDPRLCRDVAIKVLPGSFRTDPARLRRFEREARAAASLSHPVILTVYDVGLAEDTPYVVTELLEGLTLHDLMLLRRPTQQQALIWAAQVARGLDAAHCHGLVHRDVKPSNLFVTTDGRAKILDFGIAKAFGGAGDRTVTATDTSPTSPGAAPGTLAYLSPEQARAEPVDGRSDLFSLGVVLYELVSGRHPFARETPTATVAAIVGETPPELASLQPTVSPALAKLVARCLEKDPDDRFRSAHDLALALEALLHGSSLQPLADAEERGPYPGLASFTERDAAVFFGREEEVRELWARLAERRLLAVIAPSGAGKTSFVRAGVVAARPAGWAVAVCTPGSAPLKGLGRALAPVLQHDSGALQLLVGVDDDATAFELVRRWRRAHDEALLVVDQLEELFTLCPAPVQQRFAALVGRLVDEAELHVVLSLRDDFLLRCCDHDELSPVLSGLTALLPLRGADLRRALAEPARRRGCAFEDDALVEEMLAAVEGERAALPLLAFAMSRLWERRDRQRKLLTRAAYEEIGGVAGALAQHAEATLERIGGERLPLVREIFRNLATSQGTRAVAERDELLSAFPQREAAERVLRELVDARLLTEYEAAAGEARAGQSRVEVAHESLLTAWPRLAQWRAQDQDGAILRDQLKQAARLWNERGRPADLLWSGTSYREYALWRTRYPGALTALEEDFAGAMTRRFRRRRRLARAGVAAAFVALAAVSATIAASRRDAVQGARSALASKLVALGRLELDRHPAAAVAYARRSLETADTIEARLLALQALWRGPMARTVQVPGTSGMRAAFSHDGRWLAISGFGSEVSLLSDDARVQGTLSGHPAVADPRGVVFDDRGRLFTFAVRDPVVRSFAVDGRLLATLPLEAEQLQAEPRGGLVAVGPAASGPGERVVSRVEPGKAPVIVGRWAPRWDIGTDHAGTRAPTAVDPRLRWLAYGRGRAVFLHPLRPSGAPDVLVGEHDAAVRAVSFDPRGERVASADESGEIRLWSASGSRLLRRVRGPSLHRYSRLTFDAAGSRMAWSSGGEQASCLWEIDAPAFLALRCMPRRDVENGGEAVFDPSGSWLATADYGRAALWHLASPRVQRWPAHLEGPILDLAFSPDSRTLASCARDGLRLWPLAAAGGEPRRVALRGEYFGYGLAWAPSGRELALSAPILGAFLVPAAGGPARLVLPYPAQNMALGRLAYDPSGRLLAIASHYGAEARHVRVYVVELASGRTTAIPLREADGTNPWAGGVRALGFSADGRLVFAGDGGVRRWDPVSGRVDLLAGGPGTYATLALDRSGRSAFVTIGSSFEDLVRIRDSRVVALDLVSGRQRSLPGHGDGLTLALATDPLGRIVVTGDATGVVRVSSADGGEPHLLAGHDGAVSRVAVSPDGRWIASASAAEIRLWPMPDVSKPPFHTLPYDELLRRLRTLTNLQAVEDPSVPTGYRLEVGPFPGWRDVPKW